MKSIFILLSAGILLMAYSSCNDQVKQKLPSLPYLKADTVNIFNKGDRFILATGTNSCCMYCWQGDSTLQHAVPESPLLRYIETIEEPADADCAGCSSFTYRIYECTASGSDTLRYAVIPMGETGNVYSCEEINIRQTDSSHFRSYVFSVR